MKKRVKAWLHECRDLVCDGLVYFLPHKKPDCGIRSQRNSRVTITYDQPATRRARKKAK